MKLAKLVPLIIVAFCCASCQRSVHADSSRPQITVAAAANLSDVAQVLGSQFEARTGIHSVFSFASTAQLTSQIQNGAPFDVFMAADAEHADKLDREHLFVAGSKAVYAVGVLALWSPPSSPARVRSLNDLKARNVRVIALANPKLAPYGEAAVETLRRAGIWDQVQSKIVYADNISMAKQYGMSKNADAVFTAYSLVMQEPGVVTQVKEALHAPIVQEMGVVARSEHRDAAQAFARFVLGPTGRATLARFGYTLH